jgi:hypothetical protein
MNLLTALEIQGNGDNIRCEAGGPSTDNGKYVGWISLYRDGELHKHLLSSESIFESSKDAVQYMKNVVKEVREMKLDNPLDKL